MECAVENNVDIMLLARLYINIVTRKIQKQKDFCFFKLKSSLFILFYFSTLFSS